MAIVNSYDSKLNKLIKVSDIMAGIRKSSIGQELPNINNEIFFVVDEMDVIPFVHPLYDQEKGGVYIDTRVYASTNKSGDLAVRNTLDESLTVLRAQLELCWVRSENKDDVWAAFAFSNKIFVTWLTDLVAFRLGFTPLNQIRLKALIAIYSLGLFNGTEMSELELNRYIALIARNYAIPADVMNEVHARLDGVIPRNVDDLISAMAAVDFGPRSRDFSAAALYNMLSGSWYSNANSPQIVALGIEYPPAFAALVKMAIDNTMFKRSGIGQKVDKENRQNNHQNFTRSVNLLIEKYVDGE